MSKVTTVIADEIHEQDMYIEEKELVFRLSNVPIPIIQNDYRKIELQEALRQGQCTRQMENGEL